MIKLTSDVEFYINPAHIVAFFRDPTDENLTVIKTTIANDASEGYFQVLESPEEIRTKI